VGDDKKTNPTLPEEMQKIEENVSKIPDSISDEGERITNKKWQ
jgi:hypothetical protein